MSYDSVVSRTRPGVLARRRALPLLALSALLVASFLFAPAGGAAARSIAPAVGTRERQVSGTTLAVARAGGASLYDDLGKLILDLPAGAPLHVDGRTSDNRWFHGSAKDGTIGWASADRLVIFGVSNIPIRERFAPPASATSPAAATVQPSPPTGGLPAVVKNGTGRLNVRAGPGTGYAVVSTAETGAALTAAARNAAGDWIQIQQPALSGGSGWVSANYLELTGDVNALPVAALTTKMATQAAAKPAAKSTGVSGLTGKLVFQERSGGKIYVYDLASGAQRVLTTGADPALSPDGRTVAFWRGDGADYGLYLIGVDGSNERRILTRTEKLRAPAWSPDGSKIVFSHVNGQRQCRDVGYNICFPDTFPYNLMFPLKTMDQWGLARVDSGGGSYQDLAAIADAVTPDWSEHGIFYGGSGIQFTQDVSDENQNRVVLSEYRYQDPAAQPGGNRIVFHSLEKDHWEIFTANDDGSNVTALTRPATTLVTPLPHNVAPVWSPDGKHIIFLSNRTGQWKFWVMNPDGSEQRQLPISVPVEYAYQGEQVASWGK